jgi:hypothetical protein
MLTRKKKEENCAVRYSTEALKKISDRAYFIWINKGKSANSAQADWLQAERELKKEGKI